MPFMSDSFLHAATFSAYDLLLPLARSRGSSLVMLRGSVSGLRLRTRLGQVISLKMVMQRAAVPLEDVILLRNV